MIAALLCGLSLAFPGRFVEDQVPSSRQTVIEAVALVNSYNAKRRSLVDWMAKGMVAGTEDFSSIDLRQATLESGGTLRVTSMPDHLRIRMVVSSQNWDSGLRQLESMLRRATFDDEKMQEARDTLSQQGLSVWGQALDPVPRRYEGLNLKELKALYKSIEPEKVSVVISGSFPPGAPRTLWQDLTEGWKAKPILAPAQDIPELRLRSTYAVTSVELRGKGAPAEDFAPLALAAFVLGPGKGSTAFKVLRKEKGWSYRQEAALAAAPGGVRLRILLAFGTRPDQDSIPDQAREALLAAISKWTESDRERALALAEASLTRNLINLPFAFTAVGACTADDRTFLQAYWPLLTGSPWTTRGLLVKLKTVDLDTLKTAASEQIAGSKTILVPGR